MAMKNKDFCVFIMSHGRADRVFTYKTIMDAGYSGKLFIVIDNEDETAPRYYELFGDKVIMFDKKAIAETFDEGDNFRDRRAVIYPRNACFEIAKKLGITYFMELDDDYNVITYKINRKFTYINYCKVRNIDAILDLLIDYYKSIPAKSIAIAQGGDFIGGWKNGIDRSIGKRRKCMNTFILSTERPFQFVGRVNEDVNTYTWFQSLGNLFLTFPLVAIGQVETQHNPGGMTEMYLDSGTYVKSFYTVMYQPSSVTIRTVGTAHPRIHHHTEWDNTVPCIISEDYKKK